MLIAGVVNNFQGALIGVLVPSRIAQRQTDDGGNNGTKNALSLVVPATATADASAKPTTNPGNIVPGGS